MARIDLNQIGRDAKLPVAASRKPKRRQSALIWINNRAPQFADEDQ